MKQFTQREFIRIVEFNGFNYARQSGGHLIYTNNIGKHISIPTNIRCVIAHKLIKEHSLNINLKKGKANG